MPELTKHCRLCEACMLSLDHHCLFLTRCVAGKNHRAFVFFMLEVILANILFVRAAVTCEYITLVILILLLLFLEIACLILRCSELVLSVSPSLGTICMAVF